MIVGPSELSNHDLPDEERYDFPTRPTAEGARGALGL